jgi:hypothetical protein
MSVLTEFYPQAGEKLGAKNSCRCWLSRLPAPVSLSTPTSLGCANLASPPFRGREVQGPVPSPLRLMAQGFLTIE